MRALVDQVGDAVRQHPRLAGSGAGDDQQRAVTVDDGVELIGVEAGRVGVGREGVGIAFIGGGQI